MRVLPGVVVNHSCWKLDRECHVGFRMFLTPHELNFELLIKTQKKRKMKRNAWKLSCILLFWNTVFIRSCPVVYVLYIWCRDPGVENRDSTALKNVLNEIVVNASWKHVGDMSQSGKKKLKNLRKFRDGHRKFVEKTIEDAKGLIAEGNLVEVKRLKFLRTALETKYSELQSLDREIVDLLDDVEVIDTEVCESCELMSSIQECIVEL